MKGKAIVFIIILFLPCIVTSQTNKPQIISNNNEFIEEFENPITLNWTVIDNNLRLHEIFNGKRLIDTGNYNFTTQTPIDITLEFSLGNGRYNFTLIVYDADNNTVSNSIEVLKGSEPEDLPTLNFSPISGVYGIFILIGVLLTIWIRRNQYNIE